jgi:four helix bundle protein
MKKKHNYKELLVWQKARMFVSDIYTITREFPKEELFCLTQQMRRASISIPSNIAEGFGRGSEAQIVHFLDIAQGSAFEIETQVYLSFDQNYFNQSKCNELILKIDEIKRMIESLQNSYLFC